MHQKIKPLFVIMGLTIFLVMVSVLSGINQSLTWQLSDQMAVHLRKHATPHPLVSMILIDDASLDYLAPMVGRFPWPRGIYAPIIEFLAMGNADAIVFDMLFSEPESSISSHNDFKQAIQNHPNVYVSGIVSNEPTTDHSPPPHIQKSYLSVTSTPTQKTPHTPTLYHPLDDLAQHATRIPITTITPDSDGLYRRMPLMIPYHDQWLMTLPISPFASDDVTVSSTTLTIGHRHIPITNHHMQLNWYPKGIPAYSFAGIISSWQSMQNGETPLIDPATFSNHIVIIGSSAVGLHDLKSTPIHSHVPGAEIQATALSNIWQGDTLKPLPLWISYGLGLLALVLIPSYLIKSPSLIRYGTVIGVPAILLGLMVGLFTGFNIVFDTSIPIQCSLIAGILTIAYNSLFEYREKQKIKQTFAMYVSPKILKELSENYKTIQPEMGKEKEVSILFSDIRNFTSLTETTPVDQIITLLNEYFDAMIDIIQQHDGTVDKIIGDAVMAFWNAPVDSVNHALLAVNAAIDMQRRLQTLNQEWRAQGRLTIATGIGINTGTCIIGNIGSKRRVNYTLIGDSVNAAARLEALCKNYEDNILISESTYTRLEGKVHCEFIDNVTVKGKTEPISIYAPKDYL